MRNSLLILIFLLPNMLYAAGEPNSKWNYSGNTGPEFWNTLSHDYQQCKDGKNQSPININSPYSLGQDKLTFHYHSEPTYILNNSITLLVKIMSSKQYLVFHKKKYKLINIHIHSPSEHRILGHQFPMELHMVHKNKDNEILVAAVMVEQGEKNRLIHVKFKNLPKEMKKPKLVKDDVINPSDILPLDKTYYSYLGSLTTPPCSEGIKWVVFKNPIEASKEQIELFRTRLYKNNARPVQRTVTRRLYRVANEIK